MCELSRVTRFRAILDSFARPSNTQMMSFDADRSHIIVPKISKADMRDIIETAMMYFAASPTLVEMKSPCKVVGDIHGHILDLYRILNTFGLPTNFSYLFMGDLVDRGEFCLETVTLIYLLRILYPSNVVVIRGNHEFDFMCSTHGFKESVMEEYRDSTIYNLFIESFSHLPLAALIDKNIVCMHGGISKHLFSVDQIRRIKKPFTDFGDPLNDDILWSDPNPNESGPDYCESTRGIGHFFGQDALDEFLKDNQLELLVRAHECVQDGCIYRLKGKSLTVFGASNYCGVTGNKSGALVVSSPTERSIVRFPPLPYIRKGFAVPTLEPTPRKGGSHLDKFPAASSKQSSVRQSSPIPRKSGRKSAPDLSRLIRKEPILRTPRPTASRSKL